MTPGPIKCIRAIHALKRSWWWTVRAYAQIVLAMILTLPWAVVALAILAIPYAVIGTVKIVTWLIPGSWNDSCKAIDRLFPRLAPGKFTDAERATIKAVLSPAKDSCDTQCEP